jgi:hypothetical protein
VIGRNAANSGSTTSEQLDKLVTNIGSIGGAGHFLARTYTGLGGSVLFGKWGDSARGGAATSVGSGSSGLAVPEPVTGALHVAPVHITDTNLNHVRGRMRGFFQLCNNTTALSNGDTITGSGAYTGRTFLAIKPGANACCYCLDITGPWETN